MGYMPCFFFFFWGGGGGVLREREEELEALAIHPPPPHPPTHDPHPPTLMWNTSAESTILSSFCRCRTRCSASGQASAGVAVSEVSISTMDSRSKGAVMDSRPRSASRDEMPRSARILLSTSASPSRTRPAPACTHRATSLANSAEWRRAAWGSDTPRDCRHWVSLALSRGPVLVSEASPRMAAMPEVTMLV